MSEEQTGSWGIVPRPIVETLMRLQHRLQQAVAAMDSSAVAGDVAREHDAAFQRMAHAANVADRVSNDYRSVFNAYVHRYHRPKPAIGELARAQDTIIQTFAKRYTAKTTAAIDSLLSDQPDLGAIRQGIRTLGYDDLWGISDQLDRALKAATDDPRFKPWLPNPRATETVPDLKPFLEDPLVIPGTPTTTDHPVAKL